MVAILPHVGLHGGLSVHLLLSLLCHEAADRGRRLDLPLLWLHAHYGVFVLLADGVDRLFRLLLVHPQDLQRGQGGLRKVRRDDPPFFFPQLFSIFEIILSTLKLII